MSVIQIKGNTVCYRGTDYSSANFVRLMRSAIARHPAVYAEQSPGSRTRILDARFTRGDLILEGFGRNLYLHTVSRLVNDRDDEIAL